MNNFFRMSLIRISFYICLVLFSCNTSEKYSKPLSPEEELLTFSLDSSMAIELIASEPIVEEPISMVFDEAGNIYVIELPYYTENGDSDIGMCTIKYLIDTNADGKMDDFVIFADSLKVSTSIFPWKGGLLVAGAPYIYFLRDTTGDFKADYNEILFTGFYDNNPDAQISSLTFNIDNWIYATNYGQPGEIYSTRKPNADPLQIQNADFRFRLDRDLYERASTPGQFGQTFNDYGSRFVTHHTTHIQESVIPARYIDRHDYLPSIRAGINISDHGLRMFQLSETPYWRVQRSTRRQIRYDEQGLDRTEYIDNHFTGASGGTYYGGSLFPKKYQGSIFTGDVMGNLVHRDVLNKKPTQLYHSASRADADQEKEFMASTDPWFRPVNFTVGPDGSLYVIDMYRQHIEAPFSIPDDLKEEMDYTNGENLGRIYRIIPKGYAGGMIPENVTRENSPLDYVEWLTKSNQWHRITGQRMLLELQDKSVIPDILHIFNDNTDPKIRLGAFYVLEGLDALNVDMIRNALRDPNSKIKEHALVQAENYPDLIPDILELSTDSSLRVVMQAILSLGEFEPTDEIKAVLSKTLIKNYNDPFMRRAVLSSKAGMSTELFQSLIDNQFFVNIDENKLELASQFGHTFGTRTDEDEQLNYLNLISKLPKSILESSVKGFNDGLERVELELSNEVKSVLDKLDIAL